MSDSVIVDVPANDAVRTPSPMTEGTGSPRAKQGDCDGKLESAAPDRLGRDEVGDVNREPTGDADREPAGDADREPSGDVDREPSGDVDREPSGDADREPASDGDREPACDADRDAERGANSRDSSLDSLVRFRDPNAPEQSLGDSNGLG